MESETRKHKNFIGYEYKEIESADQIAKRIEEHERALMQKLHDLFGKDGE